MLDKIEKLFGELTRRIFSNAGNGIIDCYPLKKLLIFRKETFEQLKSELAAFELKLKPGAKKDPESKPTTPPRAKITPRRTWHAFEPSRISHAYDADYWRWQRVSEGFKEYAQDYE